MGSRPLRMKVRWGCPPRVLSPPPHRTQSWRPCLPGQPWASGWRSTDRPVPSPRGWTIGFSERGAAHNRALPRCLSSRRCMRSWRVRGWPLSRPEAARPPPPSSLPSMAEWPGGTRAFPRWRERSRCTCAHKTPPLGGTVRVSRPRPVSWQPLAAKAYSAAGQAASALHAMAILQVHQAKALKQVHEGSTDPGLMQELRTATDFALRATKVTARSLGKAMSTMVVQESHLWLNLAEMKDVDKARFLDAPISQGGLFGDTVEGFAQQFSAVQQQTEAIQHILPRRDAPSTAAPGARPQSARCRGRPPASSRAAPPQAESTHRPVRRASRRRAAPPASQPGPKSSRKSTKRPWRGQPGDVGVCSFSGDGENSAAPSPGGGPGGESSVSFCFCSTFSKKEQFPFPPGSQVHGTTVCDALPPHSRPRPILPVAKRVRFGDDIPPHAPLASPVRDPGSSVRMPQNAPPSVPSTPTPFRCTTTGTSIVPLEPLAQRLEAWLTLPSLSRWLTRTIRLGYAIQFARRSSQVAVRNAPVLREEIAVLLAKDAIEPVPPAEMRQGFYSPYFIVPKKGGGLRPILDLRVLNRALHKLPFKMLTHRRMIKCIQPQDWFAAIDLKDAYFHVSILPRHRPFLRFALEGRAWQYRVLPFGLSLSPRVFTKVVEGTLTPLREVGVRILNYLDDWLILAQSREQLERSQGLGAPAPQPVGASGQLGKEQAFPCAENLFSRCGVRLGEYDGTPHGGTCPSSAELPKFLQRQECGTTETVSEAPGAYGIRSCSHAARIASYETTSALATLPGPEVGMAPRYTASRYLPAVSPLPQPLDRPCLSTGRGAPRTSVPAYCCHNRCLQHGLGRYMQRAGSLGALDRASSIVRPTRSHDSSCSPENGDSIPRRSGWSGVDSGKLR